MGSNGTNHVKVRVIVTRFVQTDERHFKSVVQNLTGMYSVVGGEGDGGGREAEVGQPLAAAHGRSRTTAGSRKDGRVPGNPMPPATLGDLHRMITELPSLEELRDIWVD
uniref:Mediator of RNA polymerase II transcription subunit 13-like n=1 Tax=Anthurium amnicola TaxID=1678845 RepID=A0A1D1ZBD2_9ARAE